jgi:hypothetical protein
MTLENYKLVTMFDSPFISSTGLTMARYHNEASIAHSLIPHSFRAQRRPILPPDTIVDITDLYWHTMLRKDEINEGYFMVTRAHREFIENQVLVYTHLSADNAFWVSIHSFSFTHSHSFSYYVSFCFILILILTFSFSHSHSHILILILFLILFLSLSLPFSFSFFHSFFHSISFSFFLSLFDPHISQHFINQRGKAYLPLHKEIDDFIKLGKS